MSEVKVIGRFAPTPSGELHLGNLLCAMLAWLSAKSRGGSCLLRIEDVDLPRCPEKNTLQVLRDLEWFGFEWDGDILYQSKRGEIYREYLNRLKLQGIAYPCFCTRTQLHQAMAPNAGDTIFIYPGICYGLSAENQLQLSKVHPPAIRLHVPDQIIAFKDMRTGLCSKSLQKECGDFIVRRSDGMWGYHLAAVIDDALTHVNQVVRGRDILSSTPQQIWLQRQLGFKTPEYYHIPLLTDSNHRRLAKRDRDIGLSELKKHYSRDQILGILAYAARLIDRPEPVGWNTLLEKFDWSKVPDDDLILP